MIYEYETLITGMAEIATLCERRDIDDTFVIFTRERCYLRMFNTTVYVEIAGHKFEQSNFVVVNGEWFVDVREYLRTFNNGDTLTIKAEDIDGVAMQTKVRILHGIRPTVDQKDLPPSTVPFFAGQNFYISTLAYLADDTTKYFTSSKANTAYLNPPPYHIDGQVIELQDITGTPDEACKLQLTWRSENGLAKSWIFDYVADGRDVDGTANVELRNTGRDVRKAFNVSRQIRIDNVTPRLANYLRDLVVSEEVYMVTPYDTTGTRQVFVDAKSWTVDETNKTITLTIRTNSYDTY